MESDRWIYLFTFLGPKEMSKRLAVETWTLTRTQILLPAIHEKKKKKELLPEYLDQYFNSRIFKSIKSEKLIIYIYTH
jgi:hypothetical protein